MGDENTGPNHFVSYTEFLAALSTHCQGPFPQSVLKHLFLMFTDEGDQHISKVNILHVIKNFGKTLSMKEIDNEFESHQPIKSDSISFDEFSIIMNEDTLWLFDKNDDSP